MLRLDSSMETKCLVSSRIVLVEIDSADDISSSSSASGTADFWTRWWLLVMLEITMAYRRLNPTWSFSGIASSDSLASNCAKVL